MLQFILVSFLLGGIATGQDVLSTYEEVRSILADGQGFVSAVIDLSKCRNDAAEPPVLVTITEQFRTWLVVTSDEDPTQGYIESDQFFLDVDGYWTIIKTTLGSDDITRVAYNSVNGLDLATPYMVNWECSMGQGGATYFVRGASVEFDDLNDYTSLKSALVIGRHIFTTIDLSQCSPGIPGASIQAGFYINDWEAFNDGQNNEQLELFYPYKLIYTGDGQGSNYAATSTLAVIRRDEGSTVAIDNALLDLFEWTNDTPFPEFTCNLGTSMKFYAPHPDIEEATYQTYNEVLNALVTAHDLEAMIFGSFCQWDGGERYSAIYGHRFYHYDWQGPGAEGPQNYIEFQDSIITPGGIFVDEDYSVQEDDTLIWSIYRVNLATGEESNDRAVCPLGSGALFRAGLREKTELFTFEEIEQVILNGRQVNFEIIVQDCIAHGDSTIAPGIFGGRVEQTLDIDQGNDDRAFYSSVTSAFRDEASGSYFWTSINIFFTKLAPTVTVIPAFFDAGTWDNILAGVYYDCTLGETARFFV